LASWGRQQCRWNKGFAETARKLLPSIWYSDLPWARKLDAALHLGGCAFGLLVVATGILCWIDLLVGTPSYSLILPLAALGLLQGLTCALAMALLSSNLLRRLGTNSQSRSFATTCRLTLYTVLMHHYAAALSAGSVVAGIRGRRSGFVRTPKQVRLSG
jgi:hypothetical protein